MFRSIMMFVSVCALAFSFIFPAIAKDKPQLTVYSYSSFLSQWGPGEKIKQDFEAQCDCQVNIVSIGDGVTIINRLRLEGAKTNADVMVGLDTNLIHLAKSANLVQPHHITKPDNLAVDWWDTEFIPYDYGYFAFIYNQEKISAPPESLDQLLNNDHNWKIIYQDPRTSTPGLGLLLWINKVYGDKATTAWQNMAQHTLTVTKGWSESYSLFLKGEADFVLSYNTSPVVHIINDQDYRYKAAVFTEGHYQQIEIAAITQATKQPELARQFLAFLLTPAIQRQFVEKNVMYPAIKIPLPEAYQSIPAISHALSFTPEEVNANQKQWIKQWQNAVSQ